MYTYSSCEESYRGKIIVSRGLAPKEKKNRFLKGIKFFFSSAEEHSNIQLHAQTKAAKYLKLWRLFKCHSEKETDARTCNYGNATG